MKTSVYGTVNLDELQEQVEMGEKTCHWRESRVLYISFILCSPSVVRLVGDHNWILYAKHNLMPTTVLLFGNHLM